MKAYLIIIFLINGEPAIQLDGYAPMELDLKKCAASIKFTKEYLASVPTLTEVYDVICGTEEEIRLELKNIFNSEPT